MRPYRWFIASNIASKAALGAVLLTRPGSAAAVAVALLMGLTAAGQLPIINTAYYTRTPKHILGRVNAAGWTLVLAALPFASLLMGWLVNTASPSTGIAVVLGANVVMIGIFCAIPAMRLVDERPYEHADDTGAATRDDTTAEHADDTGAATRDDTTAERVDATAGYADADDGLSVDAGVGVAA